MKKILLLLPLALTGLCASSASAGSWMKINGGSGAYVTVNASASGPFTVAQSSHDDNDPDPDTDPVSIYQDEGFFDFRFFASSATPNEQAPTSGNATQILGFTGGPLIANAQGASRAQASAHLYPYDKDFVKNNPADANDIPTVPAGVKTFAVPYNSNNVRTVHFTGPDEPLGGTDGQVLTVYVKVSAYGNAHTDGRPGDTANASTNGIGIRINDVIVPTP